MYTSIPQIRSLIAKTLHRCMWQLHWTVEKSKKFLFKKKDIFNPEYDIQLCNWYGTMVEIFSLSSDKIKDFDKDLKKVGIGSPLCMS